MAGFNADLLMYYLGGIGGEIGGEDWMKKLGGMAQETQKAKSQTSLIKKYQDTFSKMVGGDFGDVPEGTKINMDRDKAVFTIPSDKIFDRLTGGSGEEEEKEPTVIQPQVPRPEEGRVEEKNVPGRMQSRISEGFLNPSASPSGITGADLVGLTTQDISQALSGALNVAKFKQRVPYMKALTAESRTRAAEATPSYTAPGIDVPMTRKEALAWSKIPEVPDKVPVKTPDGDIVEVDPKTALNYYARMNRSPVSYETYLRATKDSGYYDFLKAEAAAKAKSAKGTAPKRALVTWTTATRELTKRFGKLDPTGMWVVTPELQAAHNKAQELLVDYKDAGVDPLRAVNDANKHARVWLADREKRFYEYVEAAQGISNKTERSRRIEQVQDAYFREYGYVPSTRR